MFKNFKLFRMLGVDVYLNATWFFVFLLFFTWSGTTLSLFLTELSTVLIVFGAVLLHEFGHILAARKYGVSTDKVVLHLLGGAAFINVKEAKNLTPKQNLWVYFAGPLVNLVISVLAFTIFTIYTAFFNSAGVDGFHIVFGTMFLINAILFVFNLLPIFPMDGGGLLRNFLLHIKVKKAIIISAVISMLFCLALLVFSIMFISITGIIISILFFIYAIAEIKKEQSENGIINFGPIEIDTNEDEEDLDS